MHESHFAFQSRPFVNPRLWTSSPRWPVMVWLDVPPALSWRQIGCCCVNQAVNQQHFHLTGILNGLDCWTLPALLTDLAGGNPVITHDLQFLTGFGWDSQFTYWTNAAGLRRFGFNLVLESSIDEIIIRMHEIVRNDVMYFALWCLSSNHPPVSQFDD